mmetsp:Transcript_61682/g.72079  ORF Transcript_61682/g.72079 Transcript_61682/m.72079 type:complete len:205 (-) Transcript_61682:271-885(-)
MTAPKRRSVVELLLTLFSFPRSNHSNMAGVVANPASSPLEPFRKDAAMDGDESLGSYPTAMQPSSSSSCSLHFTLSSRSSHFRNAAPIISAESGSKGLRIGFCSLSFFFCIIWSFFSHTYESNGTIPRISSPQLDARDFSDFRFVTFGSLFLLLSLSSAANAINVVVLDFRNRLLPDNDDVSANNDDGVKINAAGDNLFNLGSC